MAAIALNDTVKLHGGVEGKVISKKDTDTQKFVVVSYEAAYRPQTTIRETNTLVEESANVFVQRGVSQ